LGGLALDELGPERVGECSKVVGTRTGGCEFCPKSIHFGSLAREAGTRFGPLAREGSVGLTHHSLGSRRLLSG